MSDTSNDANKIAEQASNDLAGTIEDLGERVRKLEQTMAYDDAAVDNAPPAKIPKLTAVCLFVLCALAIGTGVRHWYTTYFVPAGEAAPALVEVAAFEPAPPVNAPVPVPDEAADVADDNDYLKYDGKPYEPFIIPRPVLEPRPQFVQLWDYFGKDNIVGHLFIEGTDFNEYVLQYEYGQPAAEGWAFIDHQVDILMADALNWVIFGQNGSAMQDTLRRYFDDEFFLRHPVITFNTQYAEYEWEIFSFYVAPMDFPFAVVDHPMQYWGDMVEAFTLAALYNTRLDVTEYDQVLTLTAPASGAPGLYYVLQARLLRHITS